MNSQPSPHFSPIKLELWPYHQKHVKNDNFELHGSLKFSFTNIQGLSSNVVHCE